MTLNILWWAAFFVLGLALQQALPGTDVLVAGLFLALQERRPFQLAVVLFALILVQEGVGTLDFGTSVLWYLLVITLFFAGRWMFETENWLFVLLLSGCIGLAHYGVIWLMTRLQFIPLDMTRLLDESILQALLTPFVWQCSMMARRWVVPNENNTALKPKATSRPRAGLSCCSALSVCCSSRSSSGFGNLQIHRGADFCAAGAGQPSAAGVGICLAGPYP